MKFISAKISNFRLLKDLSLNFSTDKDKPLTVIRAANETGKTTCQNALMWCLYGSKALPSGGRYSLFPSDELAKGLTRIDVSVEIEFQVDHVRGLGRGRYETVDQRYRLSRSCTELPPGKNGAPRSGEIAQLWRITPAGTQKVEDGDVQAIIEDALPESLKDVYFTDGDSAMSFIEAAASQGVKRQRVTNAIESLLGLNILERTVSHLNTVASKFSQEIDNTDYAKEAEHLNDRIVSYQEDIAEWKVERDEASREVVELQKNLMTNNAALDKALQLGDKEKLVKKKDSATSSIDKLAEAMKLELKRVAGLTYSEGLSTALLSDHLTNAKRILTALSDKKQLPKANVPILEELLDRETCFCGSDLRASTSDGHARRSKITESIEASRALDKISESATSLFYRVRSIDTEGADDRWMNAYSERTLQLQHLSSSLSAAERELDEVENDIRSINDSHVEKLREQRDRLTSALQTHRSTEATRAMQIDEARSRLSDAERDLERVRKKLGKTNTSATNWDIAKDAKEVFSTLIDLLLKEELKKVSDEMNRILLSMIGSGGDSSDQTLIKSAKLTEEFDIMVYGPVHSLNPDQDLNGASRRAITLAFILALTKVSQVEAPNIIDTPLGMMSGYVKQSVLMNTIKEGSQVILFLTHDEIMGVEEIIDRYAGAIFTLTNPGHYPKMLAHPPKVNDSRVLRCGCNHRQSCEVCERKSMEVA